MFLKKDADRNYMVVACPETSVRVCFGGKRSIYFLLNIGYLYTLEGDFSPFFASSEGTFGRFLDILRESKQVRIQTLNFKKRKQ